MFLRCCVRKDFSDMVNARMHSLIISVRTLEIRNRYRYRWNSNSTLFRIIESRPDRLCSIPRVFLYAITILVDAVFDCYYCHCHSLTSHCRFHESSFQRYSQYSAGKPKDSIKRGCPSLSVHFTAGHRIEASRMKSSKFAPDPLATTPVDY